MQEIIAKPDRPTALLTGYDSIAIGAMCAILVFLLWQAVLLRFSSIK